MAENVVFTGMAKPPEKRTLVGWGKEKLKKSFTFAGVEEVWREKHAKEIDMVKKISDALPDTEKEKAMVELEKTIKNKTRIKVVGNYGAAALVTATATFGGLYAFNKDFRWDVNRKINEMPTGREILRDISERAMSIRERVRDIAEEVKWRGSNAIDAIKGN